MRGIQTEQIPPTPSLSQETLRIMPVSAEGTAVEFDRDTDILGYRIPAGTLIW